MRALAISHGLFSGDDAKQTVQLSKWIGKMLMNLSYKKVLEESSFSKFLKDKLT